MPALNGSLTVCLLACTLERKGVSGKDGVQGGICSFQSGAKTALLESRLYSQESFRSCLVVGQALQDVPAERGVYLFSS